MKPSDYYQNKVNIKEIQDDAHQRELLPEFDRLHAELLEQNRSWINRYLHPKREIKGLYLWGSVGIGKTFMMDCFFETLPFENKKRIHFHAFMKEMHEKLNQFRGKKDPIKLIAKELLKDISVLCFDEFFVNDITDAMLLGALIQELFRSSFCLVVTSNVPPDRLYWHGLQRQNFLPAIAVLEKKLSVINLESFKDYRATFLKKEGAYYTPLDKKSAENMERAFALHSEGEINKEAISILGRTIPVIKRSRQCIWFEFKAICGVPRSQMDYIELAKEYDTVLVANVVKIKASELDLITCLINMIDVFYDAKVKLIISAEDLPNQIYTENKLNFEFARTQSRLQEMGSEDYFRLS